MTNHETQSKTTGQIGAKIEQHMSSALLTSLAEILKVPESVVRRHALMQAAKMLDGAFRELSVGRGALVASIGAVPEFTDDALAADLDSTVKSALEQARIAGDALEGALTIIDDFRGRAAQYVKDNHPDVYADIIAKREAYENGDCECFTCTVERAKKAAKGQQKQEDMEQQHSQDNQASQADQADQADQSNQGGQGCQGCGKCKSEAVETGAAA